MKSRTPILGQLMLFGAVYLIIRLFFKHPLDALLVVVYIILTILALDGFAFLIMYLFGTSSG